MRVVDESTRIANALTKTIVDALDDKRTLQATTSRTVLLHRWRLRNGYDERGRYWGVGSPLYRAVDERTDKEAFVRAHSRREAAKLLGIPDGALVHGLEPN